jgi:hypothetical protein
MVGIELLLVGQSFKVGFDGEGDHRGRTVGPILFECFRVYAGRHVMFVQACQLETRMDVTYLYRA